MIYEPERLSGSVRLLVEDQTVELLISHASIWELLNKVGRGRLLIAGTSTTNVLTRILELTAILLPITLKSIRSAADLPHIHSDPFDRMLIAQAVAEQVPLVTIDDTIWQYPVTTIWN